MVHFTPIHSTRNELVLHDDVNKCQHFPRYWPFVRGIHPSPVVPLTKASYAQLLCVFFICAWTNIWANKRDAADLGRHCAHYDATVMFPISNSYQVPIRHASKSLTCRSLIVDKFPYLLRYAMMQNYVRTYFAVSEWCVCCRRETVVYPYCTGAPYTNINQLNQHRD